MITKEEIRWGRRGSASRRGAINNGTPMRMIDTLERRQLLAWSTYATLIGQDTLAATRSTLTGSGQTVAVIDTGIDYNHPALGGGFGKGKKVISGYDWAQNDNDPMDTDGHGTSVSSFIAGKPWTYGGKTYQGIAPDAKIVALRVGTGRNSYTWENIEKALQWVITNRTKFSITTVNMSLSGGNYSDYQTDSLVSDEFATLKELGVFVVAASGNDGTDEMGYPSVDRNVFSAGSITHTDAISDFTQRMKLLDLLAPGQDVVSAKRNSTDFTTGDGTSYACPMVAGAAMLVRQAAPTFTVDDIASTLRTSSVANRDGDNELFPATHRVYGRLDLVNAIKLAEIRNSTATLDALTTNKYSTVDTAYDKSGILHVAFYNPTTSKLNYATRSSAGKWTTPVVVDTSNANLGQHLSIALDQAGRPAIAYYDSTNADLKYASLSLGTVWTNRVIDSKNSVGYNPSLVFNEKGDPRIAYYNRSAGRLRYASFDSGTNVWSTSTIDGSADVGTSASMAFYDNGGTGITGIAYSDLTNGNLKFARSTNGTTPTWEVSVLDDLQGVSNIDLTLAKGQPRIAYQDVKNADVKYTWKKDLTWAKFAIAQSGTVGKNIRSYFDHNDAYHVVYYDATKVGSYDALISASKNNVTSTARVGSAGQLASVAMAVDGRVTFVALNGVGKSLGASEILAEM